MLPGFYVAAHYSSNLSDEVHALLRIWLRAALLPTGDGEEHNQTKTQKDTPTAIIHLSPDSHFDVLRLPFA